MVRNHFVGMVAGAHERPTGDVRETQRSRQPGQLVGLRADVLTDEGLQDGRQIQLLLLQDLLTLGAPALSKNSSSFLKPEWVLTANSRRA